MKSDTFKLRNDLDLRLVIPPPLLSLGALRLDSRLPLLPLPVELLSVAKTGPGDISETVKLLKELAFRSLLPLGVLARPAILECIILPAASWFSLGVRETVEASFNFKDP